VAISKEADDANTNVAAHELRKLEYQVFSVKVEEQDSNSRPLTLETPTLTLTQSQWRIRMNPRLPLFG